MRAPAPRPLILTRRRAGDGVLRGYLTVGTTTDVDNVTAILTPAPEDGPADTALRTVLRDVLQPGWEAFLTPLAVPPYSAATATVHVGGRIERAGATLELARAIPVGDALPHESVHALVAALRTTLLDALDATA